MSISLCIIAKDEEELIKDCILSAKDLVDEIIVLDTGSEDKTMEIAKSLGAKVYEDKWDKDFSKARNQCIAYATCDFILILDCDERLIIDNLNEAKNFFEQYKNSNLMGCNIQIVNLIKGAEAATFNALRIFRNHKGFSYKGKLHEQILNDIQEKYGENSITNIPLKVHHLGYEEMYQKLKNKRSRNLEILESITDRDGYYFWALGNEYLQANNLREAEKHYRESMSQTTSFRNSYGTNLLLNYLSVLVNLNKREEALKIIEEKKQIIPEFADLYFLEFWINFFKGEYKKALEPLETYILSTKDPSYHREKYYENIYPLEKMKEEIIKKIN